ncbi:MAG: 5'/3'-nucleotidase SurE [Dehalococcoidia bacterium]|nr:5'/3'-nucleotidase SurE [Dehalococcoidia bacterium]
MRLLLTNDDGIHAPGILALVKSLRGLGEITVVAPDREQSGMGASFTLHRPVRVRRLRTRGARYYAVDGTPGDAVIVALGHIMAEEKPDLVISGINHGTNLGADVFLSGTVGAALHAHIRGIPSIAISMPLRKRLRYRTAAAVARSLAEQILADTESYAGLLFNVTVPNLGLDKLQGVEITNLVPRAVNFDVTHGNDGRRDYYWISVERQTRSRRGVDIQEGTDVWALREKKVSITPVQMDATAYGAIEKLGNLQKAVSTLTQEGVPN